MRILAVETSGRHGSLAVLAGDDDVKLLRETSLVSSEPLRPAPAPCDLLTETNWPPASIGMVTGAVGPWPFTGLRIGVTTAKAFAYAVGAEIVGVNTLEVLALQAAIFGAIVGDHGCAQRQELFAAKFETNGAGGITMSKETRIIPQDEWLAGLCPGDRVTGPALRRLLPRLPAEIIPRPCRKSNGSRKPPPQESSRGNHTRPANATTCGN